jgi:DNA (cytosine-5)-methyltransferase 1
LTCFCGAGGAAAGYHKAGYDEIVGVDIAPQQNYPFEFHRMDWLAGIEHFGLTADAIHARVDVRTAAAPPPAVRA